MSAIIRISKPGFNVFSETDINNIVFDSDYDTLKYHASGSISLAASGANAETTVTHGLGYIPFFVVFYKSPISTTRYSATPEAFVDVGNYSFICAYADDDKIYFTIHTNVLNATIDFEYKIFRNDTGL